MSAKEDYGHSSNPVKYINMLKFCWMKWSLKELISQIEPCDLTEYKKYTPLYIQEALKGGNWDAWDSDVFQDYFEKANNSVAYLGQGFFKLHHKEKIKKNWMEIAPHLQAIASSQDKPLWKEYDQIRTIIKSCTENNMQVATNRMLACLQPNLLCTEVDLKKLNELLDYIFTYTNAEIPSYDINNWESASFSLLSLLHSLFPNKNYLDFAYIPWKLLDLFRDKIKKEFVSYWIISANDRYFRIADCLKDNQLVDWQTSFSPKKGDIVFIYRTKPIQQICYMMEVVDINIPYHKTMKDEKYWGKDHRPKEEIDPNERNHRLKLIKETDSSALHITELRKMGLRGDLISSRKVYGKLLEYILCTFQEQLYDYDEIFNPDEIYEGAKKTIVVNSYERNREARDICIAHHGCRCAVCGLDFEKMYGDVGRGFIHVHHIVPISTIGEEYKLDPIKDLIPVCPNCHAMLHRGENGEAMEVEELRERINGNIN